MTQKTRNYDLFKFRKDNRAEISLTHVKALCDSIKIRNLLELRPIHVNERMEVLDGQHRLLAAKMAEVEIYYEVKKDSSNSDILVLSNSKPWNTADYLNFYCENGYEEYIQLKNFIESSKMGIKLLLVVTLSHTRNAMKEFKDGRYKFCAEASLNDFTICCRTVEEIKKHNGVAPYLKTGRFWKALLKVIRHAFFDEEKWFMNLSRMIERIGIRATEKDYTRMFMEVNNWKNKNKMEN